MRQILVPGLLLSLLACVGTGGGSTATDCDSCLAGGGTWQPEANECTDDCALMDISCFRDECPGECGAADDCGNCFDQASCEAATCTWQQEDEAMWCTQ